jgi:hypothetical protein
MNAALAGAGRDKAICFLNLFARPMDRVLILR